MECPQDLATRATILSHNGFGFQGPTDGVHNKFVLCFCRNLDDNELQSLQQLSGSTTVDCDDWIGHEYLQIHWNEYNKINSILTSLLQLSISFKTNTKLEAYFNATKDKQYTPELEEIIAIKRMREDPFYMQNLNNNNIIKDAFFDNWNWKTPEGKRFCEEIREKTYKQHQSINDKENYYNWSIFQNYDPNTLLSLDNNDNNDNNEPPKKKIKLEEKKEEKKEVKEVEEEIKKVIVIKDNEKNEEDDNLCLICMENVANTMVMPCEHVVVCKQCSDKLKNTNDKNTCVKCRRPITHVLA